LVLELHRERSNLDRAAAFNVRTDQANRADNAIRIVAHPAESRLGAAVSTGNAQWFSVAKSVGIRNLGFECVELSLDVASSG